MVFIHLGVVACEPLSMYCDDQVVAALKAGARSDGEVTLVLERQKS